MVRPSISTGSGSLVRRLQRSARTSSSVAHAAFTAANSGAGSLDASMNSRAASSPKSATRRFGQPHGKRVLARERLQVGLGVAEGERRPSGTRPSAARRSPARTPSGRRCAPAPRTGPPPHGGSCPRKYISYTPMRSASRTSSCTSSGERSAAVDDLVERPARAHHAQHEARGEGAVLAAHARGVDVLGDEVLREGVPLAQEAPYLERRLAGGRDVEALLGLRRFVGRLDLAPGPVAPLAVALRAVALRLAAAVTVALRLAAIPVREDAPATPFPFARRPAVLGPAPLAVTGRAAGVGLAVTVALRPAVAVRPRPALPAAAARGRARTAPAPLVGAVGSVIGVLVRHVSSPKSHRLRAGPPRRRRKRGHPWPACRRA